MRGSWGGRWEYASGSGSLAPVGMDYDGDGKVSPFGKPDDALGSTSTLPGRARKVSARRTLGLRGARREGFVEPQPQLRGMGERRHQPRRRQGVSAARRERQTVVPVTGWPAFLLGPNFYAVRSYNPSMNYALAICHLGDRILGAPPFIQPFPGSERALTLAEVQEMQTRLTKAGFDTGGTDGRVGNDTMAAVPRLPDQGGDIARRRLRRASGIGAAAAGRLASLRGALATKQSSLPLLLWIASLALQ